MRYRGPPIACRMLRSDAARPCSSLKAGTMTDHSHHAQVDCRVAKIGRQSPSNAISGARRVAARDAAALIGRRHTISTLPGHPHRTSIGARQSASGSARSGSQRAEIPIDPRDDQDRRQRRRIEQRDVAAGTVERLRYLPSELVECRRVKQDKVDTPGRSWLADTAARHAQRLERRRLEASPTRKIHDRVRHEGSRKGPVELAAQQERQRGRIRIPNRLSSSA